MFLQTIYHPLRLIAEHTQEIALDAYVDCETRPLPPEAGGTGRPQRVADLGPFKLLDAAATRDAAGRNVTLVVVNRDPDRAIETVVQLTDASFGALAQVGEVNGADAGATNSFEHPDAVNVADRTLPITNGQIEYAFPAHSVTVLRATLNHA
jgi:alpha-N-arabinofuranosidase